MDPIEMLKKENREMVELAKTEKRELSVDEMKKFNDNTEVIKFQENRAAAEEAEKRSAAAAPASVIENRAAEANLNAAAEKDKNVDAETRAIYDAIIEKRAIAVGANGDSAFSTKVFELPGDLTNILNLVTIETGAAPNTKFALFSPNVDNVTRVSEDGTSSTVSTAAFAPVTVTPAPYLAYVPITDAFKRQNPAGAIGKLPSLFNTAYLRKMAKEIVYGSGSGEMLGVFRDTAITATATTAAAGVPKMVDLIALIAKMTGRFLRSELSVVINPAYWANIMAEDTYRTHIVFANNAFTFDGVRIIENDNAPTTLTIGSIVAVIGYFKDYGIAESSTIELTMIPPVAGSLNSNLQGVAYFEGKVIVPASFAVLKTRAQS